MENNTIITPKQKRSIATKNKIKKTAKELFSQQGYYTVTSNKIAATAKVPIGSFYNYFGNKKGVLLELIKEFNTAYHEETFEQGREIIQQITSKETFKQYVPLIFKHTVLSSQLADPFYRIIHSLQFTEPDVLVLSEEIRQLEMAEMIRFLEYIHQFHPIPQISTTAKLMHAIAENIALYIHHLGTTFEKEALIERMVEMFYGLIFVE
jgi:AcrR family transcriptional regulator